MAILMAEPSEGLHKVAFKTKSQKLFRGLRSRLFPWIAGSSTVYGLPRVLLQLNFEFSDWSILAIEEYIETLQQ